MSYKEKVTLVETQYLGAEFGQFPLSLRGTLGNTEKQDLDACYA